MYIYYLVVASSLAPLGLLVTVNLTSRLLLERLLKHGTHMYMFHLYLRTLFCYSHQLSRVPIPSLSELSTATVSCEHLASQLFFSLCVSRFQLFLFSWIVVLQAPNLRVQFLNCSSRGQLPCSCRSRCRNDNTYSEWGPLWGDVAIVCRSHV